MNVSTKLACAAVALIAGMAAGAGASDAAITGMTDVTFGALPGGVTAGLYGSASLVSSSPLTVGFPITGGTLSPVSIEHDGSGVELKANGNTVDLTDFLIDLPPGDVLGNVNSPGSTPTTELFTLGTAGGPGPFDKIPLYLADGVAGALNTALGLSSTGGFQDLAQIGTATVNVSTVPEASTWAMMLAGFAGLGAATWRASRGRGASFRLA